MVLLAFAVGIAIKFSPRRKKFEFVTAAMDYLMVLIVLTNLLVSLPQPVAVYNRIRLFVSEAVTRLYA